MDYSDKITKAELLINSGDYQGALEILNKYEGERGLDSSTRLSYHLLQSLVLRYLGNYQESFKYGEKAYKESKNLKRNLNMIDALTSMIFSLIWLGDFEKAETLILEGDRLLNIISNEPLIDLEKRIASILFVKGTFSIFKGDMEKALEYEKKSLEIREKYGNKREIVESLNGIGWIYGFSKTDLDTAIKHIKHCIKLSKEINHQQITNISYANLAIIFGLKGDFEQALNYNKQALSFFEKTNNIQWITGILSNIAESYKHQGKFELALDYREKSLKLAYKMGNLWFIGNSLSNIIEDFILTGDIQSANKYLEELKQLNDQEKNKWIEIGYLTSKAMILKSSPRFQNRAKAEKILKQIIKEELLSNPDYVIDAIINLCELLLEELRITNDREILDELKPYIEKLLKIADKTHSYWFLTEGYVIQAKLALLTLNLTDARRLLTRAQQIAETHGMYRLASKVSLEHDELLQNIDIWERLKDSESALSDRLKLTNLENLIKLMIQKRRNKVPEIIDEKPIMILVISKGGIPTFSKLFAETFNVEDDLISSFLAAFNTFSGELFSEGLDRASFGEFTLIMKPLSTFLICYLFKGQSFSAQKHLQLFIEKLENNNELLDKFNEYYIKNQMIKLEDVPLLDTLIKENFISKTHLQS